MNFIGHLHVARWQATSPSFLLGAMLPDFASMAGVKLGTPSDEKLRAGIAWHHRTDAAFHHQSVFVGLMQETLVALTALGVSRGPARAVGHIGVEMLIDGELVHQDGNADAYLRALETSTVLEQDETLDGNARERLTLVHRRLRTHGVPYDYRNTEAVVMRLSRVLKSRPILAISPEDARKVQSVLPEIQRKVVAVLPQLLAAVRDALDVTAE